MKFIDEPTSWRIRITKFVQDRWRLVATVTIGLFLVLWILLTKPFTDTYTFVNAGNGKVYKVNRRTGESWLLVGNTEIAVNQEVQLTPEQELAKQQSLIEAEAATKQKELETAARIREAETERIRLQQEFARQQYAVEQARKAEEQKRRLQEQERWKQEQVKMQQEREQKLAVHNKVQAIDAARNSSVLSKVLPNPDDPQRSLYFNTYSTERTIIYMLEHEKDPNIDDEGWAAEKVAEDVYLVSYTYTTGTDSSKVRKGYYFEVDLNTGIVQNIFRDTDRFNKYQQYGINPIPVPPLLAGE